MDTKHTPTPWKTFRLSRDSDEKERLIITTADGEGEITGFIYDERDAAFILRAVNAHEALVEAMDLLLDQVKERILSIYHGESFVDGTDTEHQSRTVVFKAIAALKLAKGE